MGGAFIQELDSFLSAAGNRRITLWRRIHTHKPYLIQVEILERMPSKEPRWIELSTAEYVTEEVARKDFERRRPTMHVSEQEVPMQRGKRLVQEMLEEKLK